MNTTHKLWLWIYPVIGLILGVVLTYTYHAGLTVVWHKIEAPPVEITSFDGINRGYLYARGEEDQQFIYQLDPVYSGQSETGWKPVSPRMILDESRTPDRKWLSLPLFVDAKQSYESQFIYNIEGTAYIKLVVGPDGSLWVWKVTRPWGMTICLPIYPILGVLAGAFVAAVLAFFRSRREKHQVIKQTG